MLALLQQQLWFLRLEHSWVALPQALLPAVTKHSPTTLDKATK
jgi:hypothetical protein